MENSKLSIIKCPTCGAEYLPVEIYLPDAFFGKPLHIERDDENKVTHVVGTKMNLFEHYTCDYCNVPFKITAKLQFSTKAETKFDFDTDYTTSLKKEVLFLSED